MPNINGQTGNPAKKKCLIRNHNDIHLTKYKIKPFKLNKKYTLNMELD